MYLKYYHVIYVKTINETLFIVLFCKKCLPPGASFIFTKPFQPQARCLAATGGWWLPVGKRGSRTSQVVLSPTLKQSRAWMSKTHSGALVCSPV